MVGEVRNAELDLERTPFYPRNPRKHILLKSRNRLAESFEIAWYEGNNYLNVFVDAGVHKARFIIPLRLVEQLIDSLAKYKDKLVKAHEEWKRRRLFLI